MDYALEIVQQPVDKVRFRYEHEGKTQCGIQGSNSIKTNTICPIVKITGYNGQTNYRVSLVMKDSESKQHVHELSGTTNITVENGQQYAIFSNLSIIRKSKKYVKQIIEAQVLDNYFKTFQDKSITQLDDRVEEGLRLEAQMILNDIDLDNIRLKFDADALNSEGQVVQSLTPVFSHIISDIKQNKNFPLKIKKLDKLIGRCDGNEEIILLCEKIKKDDIGIRFYEKDLQGNLIWESMAIFEPADIHHEYAIVFKTPAYMNTNLQSPISIKVQLVCPSNQEVSNSMDFTYMPFTDDIDGIKIKRQKSENLFDYKDRTATVKDKNLQQELQSHLTSQGTKGSLLNISSSMNQFINEKFIELLRQMQFALWMYVSTNDVLHLLNPFMPLMSKPNEDGDNALHLPIIHGYKEVALNILKKLKKKKVPTATLR